MVEWLPQFYAAEDELDFDFILDFVQMDFQNLF